MCLAMLVGRFDKRRKQGMRLEWLRFEFGVELTPQEVWVPRYLNDLNVGSVWSGTSDSQSSSSQNALVLSIELVTVPVALADLTLPVGLLGERTVLQAAGPRAQPHGSTQFFDSAQLAEFVDHPVRCRRIKFAGVSLLQPTDIPRKLNARRLHAKADPKVGHLIFAGVLNALQHAFDATLSESAGNEDSVDRFKLSLYSLVLRFKPLGFDPIHLELQVMSKRAVD